MLVLGRKQQESLILGEDIEVIVVEARDGYVRLGVVAPKSLIVKRSELVAPEDRPYIKSFKPPGSDKGSGEGPKFP